MNQFGLLLLALLFAFANTPARAFECANAGAIPFNNPDDTGSTISTACGPTATSGGNASLAVGIAADADGDESVAVGYFPSSAGEFSLALGQEVDAIGTSSIAVGRNAQATGTSATVMGHDAQAAGSSAIALGRSSSAADSSSIALGYLAYGGSLSSIAVGHAASATGPYGAAIGYNAKAIGDSSVALGFSAFADQPNTVVLGSIPGINSASFYANVGMGTHTPTEAVDVQRSAAAARFQLSSHTATPSEAPQFIQRRARGTAAVPTAVLNNDNLGLFSFRGHNGSVMGGSRATITAQAAGNFTSVSTPTRLIFATTPTGETVPQQVMVITHDGKVLVNGQQLSVPDYVFEDDYALMPLEELQAFIDKHGHLPGIASADEVQTEGLDLAGSQMSQLQKIEELTLYTLQQEAELRAVREELATLRGQAARMARLEAMVGQLLQDHSGEPMLTAARN